MTLLPELFVLIARLSHPLTARGLRICNKALAKLISSKDLVWAEAGWRLHTERKSNLWAWAIHFNHVEVVRCFIAVGKGWAADFVMTRAAKLVHLELVNLAVSNGAGLRPVSEYHKAKSITDNLNCPELTECIRSQAFSAAAMGDEDILVLLINSGVDIGNETYGSMLYHAAYGGHVGVVRILLAGGVNDFYKREALMIAVNAGERRVGHADVVRALLAAGAPGRREAFRWAPLRREIRKVLREAGSRSKWWKFWKS
ncbi:hypothetical protein HDV00_006011 [Rhizophlyctis rosea]|nr:hypothetical protein HDV00_006011 [Rhizophlyctis rosea]